MPPAAFHMKKRHQGMWLSPASHAAVTRRIAMKRPKNTVLAPCFWKNRSEGGSALSA